MVHLSRPACVRLSPAVNKTAEDLLTGRGYGRKGIQVQTQALYVIRKIIPDSQDKDVAFIEKLPLSLKNLVSNTSTKGGAKACMDQMMSVIECMGKFDQNQAMCTKEINAFQTCYTNFQVQYEKSRAFRESGELPTGPRAKMTGTQMNKYMDKFLQSKRTGQTNPISASVINNSKIKGI